MYQDICFENLLIWLLELNMLPTYNQAYWRNMEYDSLRM